MRQIKLKEKAGAIRPHSFFLAGFSPKKLFSDNVKELIGETLKRKTKIILIFLLLLAVGASIAFEDYQDKHAPYKVLADNSLGTVERITYGCETSEETVALITGIHPEEKISIDPVIQAAKEYVNEHSDVKIMHYQIKVAKDDDERANGEKLAHDYVVPDVTESDASSVIISHSYDDEYSEVFYLATPEMDDTSVDIAKKIRATSDFDYAAGSDAENSSSSKLVSCPIANEGYPTFEYEIPESVSAQNATGWTKDLFSVIVKYTC